MKHKEKLPQKQLGIIIAILASISFGFYPAATKHVYEDGGNASFMMMATIFARALTLVLFCVCTRKRMMPSRAITKSDKNDYKKRDGIYT